MSLGTVIKENRVLIAGIILPLLLILLLALAKQIPLSDPPQYKVVFANNGWSQKGKLAFSINAEKHLETTFTRNKDYKSANNDSTPVIADLYLYDPKTDIVEQTHLSLSKEDESADKKIIPLEKFTNLTLSSEKTSPDGYVFSTYDYQHYNLITDIFGGYRSYGPALIKNGHRVEVKGKNSGGYYLGNGEFIGWVIDGGTK